MPGLIQGAWRVDIEASIQYARELWLADGVSGSEIARRIAESRPILVSDLQMNVSESMVIFQYGNEPSPLTVSSISQLGDWIYVKGVSKVDNGGRNGNSVSEVLLQRSGDCLLMSPAPAFPAEYVRVGVFRPIRADTF